MADEDDLKFSWELTEITRENLSLQIDFEQPLKVSSSGQDADQVMIKFLANELFMDEENETKLEANQTLI